MISLLRSKYNRIRVVVIFIIGAGVILIVAILNWWQLFSEFIGVVMGVLLAFWINNQHEKKLDRKRSVEFLKLIHDELTENNDTLRKTIAEFQTQVGYHLPYYRLRLFAWNALSNRISLIENEKLRADIIRAYYKFDMHERTMGRYLDLAYTVIKRPQKTQPSQTDPIVQGLESGKKALIGQIEHPEPDKKQEGMLEFNILVIQEIEAEINRLNGS